MAPGAIPRNYALATTVEKLEEDVDRMIDSVIVLTKTVKEQEERIERIVDSMVVLVDTVKLITHKVYGGGTSPESPQEILDRALEMVEKWKD